MFEWLQLLYAVCVSGEPPANWRGLAFAANIATAMAYFWIPGVMAVVFLRWKEELPYGWLWIGFVIFISACGLSHVMHAFHVLGTASPHSPVELAILITTAAVSLATAAGFTFVLPRILALSSPAAAKRRMEAAVAAATAELQSALGYQRLLLLEVHHRVKNNLQVIASLVSLHIRRTPDEPMRSLNDLRDRIGAIASVHGQLEEVGTDSLQALPFVNALASSMAVSRTAPDIIKVRGENFSVPLDHATSFALIVHEVIKTAMERAGPEAASGSIDIVLARRERTRSIEVSDWGMGRSPQPADGIGRTLVEALAVQLDASAVWERLEGGGTRFKLTFDEQPIAPRIANAGTRAA